MGLKCLSKLWSNLRIYGKVNSLDSLISIVNFVPFIFGFSLYRNQISPIFWICHLLLLFYTYVLGGLVYLVKEAETPSEYVTSFINIFIVVLVLSNWWWWVFRRPLLNTVITLTKKNCQRMSKSEHIRKSYGNILAKIKNILFIFFGGMYMSEALIYLPKRINKPLEFATMPCVGLEPLTCSPNREICLTILATSELSIMISGLNYQGLLQLLIAHTAALYKVLSIELIELDLISYEHEGNNDTVNKDDFVRQQMRNFIDRHCMILELTQKLKELYGMPIGVNFAFCAMAVMSFFLLPVEKYVTFIPVLLYCGSSFFLYCFLCQKLINASEEFERAVYSCGWENFNLPEKRKVYIMLIQSQRPVGLLAGNIVPVNIATFASTCQGIYSFVTVVKL